MFEMRGKYGTAKIFTDIVDEQSLSQVVNMLNQPFSENQVIRMMPDIHGGKGCAIGTTMTVTDKICPNLVGVDIGCGMLAIRLEEDSIDFAAFDAVIREHIPFGFGIRQKSVKPQKSLRLNELLCVSSCNRDRAEKSIGSLGGGNHFIEVDRDADGYLWLVIHTGSRHLGTEVADFYQKKAVESLHGASDASGGNADFSASGYGSIPDDLCWCEGYLFDHYVHDMEITQEFASINRQTIADILLSKMNLHVADSFTTIHNYLDTENMILRKGAVSAEKGQKLIIPMNMRDGSLVCIGKGNSDWNRSAPHGAGRIMRRSDAKQNLSLEDYEASMKDVWTTSVNKSTLDESPMAYKPMESIIENIGDTVGIVDIIKPVYNFKAGE